MKITPTKALLFVSIMIVTIMVAIDMQTYNGDWYWFNFVFQLMKWGMVVAALLCVKLFFDILIAKWKHFLAGGDTAETQFNIGRSYHTDKIDIDIDEAVKWYRRAAKQGHRQAQFYVDFINSTGTAVGLDKKWEQFLRPKSYSSYNSHSSSNSYSSDKEKKATNKGKPEFLYDNNEDIEEVKVEDAADSENKHSSRKVNCPHCGQSLRIPYPPPIGKGKCKSCSGQFRVQVDDYDNLIVTIFDSADVDAPPETITLDVAYRILDVENSATPTEIRTAYKSMMQQYHPDKVDSSGAKLKVLAAQETKNIRAAYDILKQAGKAE